MDTAGQPRDRHQANRAGLLANFLMVAGSGYFELLTGLIRSVFVMRLLGPTGNGLVGLVRLLQQYLSNSHLGVLHGVTKHLPRALGNHSGEPAERIEDVGATWIILTAGVCAIGILVAACTFPELGLQTRWVLAVGSLVFLCGQTYELYRTIGRAWQTFQPLVVASVVFSLALTGFMIWGAYVGWALGAVYGWLVASVLAVIALHLCMHLRVRLRLDWAVVRGLIVAGIPLAAMALADTLLLALDGTLLLRRGATTFGLYAGIAMQTRRYLFNLARSLTFVLMPHLLEEFARHQSTERLRATALRAAIGASCAVPCLSLATAILLPPATQTFVPRFLAAVPAGQIVAFATALMILPLAFSTVLVALDAEWHSVGGQLLGAAVIGVLAWGPAGHADMTGVALASAAGAWVVSVVVGSVALTRLGLPPRRVVGTIAGLQVPIALALVAFWIADSVAALLTHTAASTWSGCAVRLFFAAVLAVPALWYAQRRYALAQRSVRALLALRRRPNTGDETNVDEGI